MYQSLPADYEKARPILQRVMRESASAVLPLVSNRKRPDPPRSITASPGTGQALISWVPPQNKSGISGWKIYRDNENNPYATINDPLTLQSEVTLPSGGVSTYVYVSAINKGGGESIKVPVKATSDTNQYVVSGTGGSTSGGVGSLPPGYAAEIFNLLAKYGYYYY